MMVREYLHVTGFFEGDPNAPKVDEGALRGEVSKERVLGSDFCGMVSVLSSLTGSSNSCVIWTLCPCIW